MRKFYFILSLVLISITTNIKAQECLYLDYCGEEISSTAQGMTGSNKNIEAAICLTPDMLKPYIGSQISGIAVGFPDNSKLPETITCWLRVDEKTADKTATSTAVVPTTGWDVVTFTTPYTITGNEEGIYVGFSYFQASKLSCLSFVGTPNTNGAWLCSASTTSTTASWKNVSSTMKGCLSIRAILTGSIPQYDLAFDEVKAQRSIIKLGDDIVVKGTITNKATKVAHLPKIRYSLNGKEIGEYTVEVDSLAYRETADFYISIPGTEIAEAGTATVDLELLWEDGRTDDRIDNNKASVEVEVAKDVFLRKMVCEEGTGTWCGWCVRGYMGLKRMKAEHPDEFIGIGVHNSDEFVYSPYDNWMTKKISGYPSALINRDGNVYDPDYSQLSAALEEMDKIAACGVAVKASLDGDILTMQSEVKMAKNMDSELRVAFVVLEDSVMCSQRNYYSGGTYGEMGGFEDLENPAKIYMMDASRYISNTTGDENSVSLAPQKGETYTYTTSVDLTTIGKNLVQNTKNLSVVAMVIDQQTGEILNAEKTEELSEPGIHGDVNGDNTVDIADVNTVLSLIFEGTEYQEKADVNKDGVIDIADVNAILSIMFL